MPRLNRTRYYFLHLFFFFHIYLSITRFRSFIYIKIRRGEVKVMLIKASDLRLREVVNTLDGKRLGVISDVDFDLESGRIKSIRVPGTGRLLWFFGRDDDIIIPWSKIKKIGVDVILVEANNYSEPERKEPI